MILKLLVLSVLELFTNVSILKSINKMQFYIRIKLREYHMRQSTNTLTQLREGVFTQKGTTTPKERYIYYWLSKEYR